MAESIVQRTIIKIFVVLFLWVGTSKEAWSSAPVPAAGIYDDHQALKAGVPSRELPVRFKEYSHHVVGFFRSTEVKLYQLDLDRAQARALGTIFALSDGARLYLYPRYPSPVERFSDYVPVQRIGPYLYGRTVAVSAVPSGETQMSKETMVELLFDTRTGRFSTLNKSGLIDIISDDSELLAQFENERLKRRKLKLYLQRYVNRSVQSHTDQVAH